MIAIVVILVVIVGAGVAFIFLTQPTRPPEDTLVRESIAEPESLDPHWLYETAGGWVAEQAYETLYYYPFGTSDSDPSVPLLAAAQPEVSADGMQYNITLRQGITFADGTPFNASCVKWNFQRAIKMFRLDGPVFMILEPLLGGGELMSIAYGDGVSGEPFESTFEAWIASDAIKVLDTYTIQFNFDYAYAGYIAATTYRVGAFMSPTFVLANSANDTVPAGGDWMEYFGINYGTGQIAANSPMFDHTMGTGPYQLTEWRSGEFWTIELNENYWRADSTVSGLQPPAYAGSIKTCITKLNVDTTGSMLNLRTGLSDWIGWPAPNRDEIYDNSTGESSDPGIYLSLGGFSFAVTFMSFNMNPLMNYTRGTQTEEIVPPTLWMEFRKTIAYSFDYQAAIDAIYRGFATTPKSIFPNGLFGYNGSYATESYDIEQAVVWWNKAMNDSAFVDAMNAIDCELLVYYNEGNTAREQSSLLMADGFDAVIAHANANTTGLVATPKWSVVALEWPTILAMRGRRELLAWLVGWLPDYADPDNYAYPFAISNGIWPYFSGYNNSVVDAAAQAGKEAQDPAERQIQYNIIQEEIAKDQPYVYIAQGQEFRTWRVWLHGSGLNYNPMYSSTPYLYHVYKDYAAYDAAQA
ncbi:MAG: ABC transporter substrate-binding protein [Candidatus Thorarchaeota archaeon]